LNARSDRRGNGTSRLLLLISMLLFLLAAIIGVIWFKRTYLVVGKTVCRYDATELDLRGRNVTEAQFRELSSRLPHCTIVWDVPLSGGAADCESTSLSVDSFSEEDAALLDYFPALEELDLTRANVPALAAQLQEARPALSVSWELPFLGATVSGHSTVLTLDASALDTASLREILPLLPELQEIHITGAPLSEAQENELLSLSDRLTYYYSLELLGNTFSSRDTEISFAGQSLSGRDVRTIEDALPRFSVLRSVDLTDCGVSEEDVLSLERAAGVEVIREMSVYGVKFSSDATELDFSRIRIWDKGAALEALLPELPHLERVIMCDCGIRDEDMDALNKRYDNIRFVWTVYFSIFSCRTDATEFICARILNNHAELYSNQCSVLKYCPDLIALDLGHKNITDLSFLYDLPHLKYLILAENDIPDLTPIGSLKELTYLEIFWGKCMDLSPLSNCPNLTDLNISYCWAPADNAYMTLMQMPQLERLWYCGSYLTEDQLADIRTVMPDCEMYLEFTGEPTGGGWRDHPHYFEMRDAFQMYYMEGGTNGVDENGQQIVVG